MGGSCFAQEVTGAAPGVHGGRAPSDFPERTREGGGEGKGTPLELFSSGVLELEPEIWELIREAA